MEWLIGTPVPPATQAQVASGEPNAQLGAEVRDLRGALTEALIRDHEADWQGRTPLSEYLRETEDSYQRP